MEGERLTRRADALIVEGRRRRPRLRLEDCVKRENPEWSPEGGLMSTLPSFRQLQQPSSCQMYCSVFPLTAPVRQRQGGGPDDWETQDLLTSMIALFSGSNHCLARRNDADDCMLEIAVWDTAWRADDIKSGLRIRDEVPTVDGGTAPNLGGPRGYAREHRRPHCDDPIAATPLRRPHCGDHVAVTPLRRPHTVLVNTRSSAAIYNGSVDKEKMSSGARDAVAMATEEWAVALILLAVSAALVASVAAICRMLGVWRFPTLFGSTNSEKQQLTKHEEPCYMVTSESELNLSASGTFKHFDTGDARCLDLPPEPPSQQPTYDVKASPESVDSTVSDYEPTAGLQRAMSCDSMASDSSILDVEPEAPKIGQLEFGLEYDREVSELVVSVIQARDLEASEVTGSLDSYVKVSLTPHRDGKVQTKVQRDTTNPVYHERFLFGVEPDELPVKTLLLQVYSSDKYARHKLLGETDLKLGDIEIRHPLRIWMNLRDMDERPSDYGNIMFSLSYLPTAERLTAVLVKVRNVKWSFGKEMGV
ncbi:hypothetical protein LSAT2_006546 [Lamellibrachia satsuma]|nr:hypothetical protein LSAT2_006546 [Lamellibrachia satsuma]